MDELSGHVYTVTLEKILNIGNSAGLNNIDLSGNNLLNVKQMSSSSYKLDTTARIYQELSSNYVSVNGYYGLAKDAYPSVNPYSSGLKSFSTWTVRTAFNGYWTSVCWSAELGLFVAVS